MSFFTKQAVILRCFITEETEEATEEAQRKTEEAFQDYDITLVSWG